jgi:hypothetical protein
MCVEYLKFIIITYANLIFFTSHMGGESILGPFGTSSTSRLLYLLRVILRMENEDWQGKPKYSEKTCLTATLSTTNFTWPASGANPGRRGGKPATNRLSYGAAFLQI